MHFAEYPGKENNIPKRNSLFVETILYNLQPVPDAVRTCNYSLHSIESIGYGCKIRLLF